VDGTTAVESPAQLDTAADLTIIPSRLVEELGLLQVNEVPILGVGGRFDILPAFLVLIEIRGTSPRLVKVLSSPEEPYVLLGRDVLNHFRITLDGPNLVMDIE
jgi:predicted aspartyl protease